MQFSLQIFILSMAENFLHPYLDDTYLLSMYVCMYMYMYIISHCSLWHSVFLILRISMLWMMFFFFACICKLPVNVFYLSVKLFIYTKFHVFTAIYCRYNYLSTVQKWDFTSYDQISVKSDPGLVVRKSLLIQVNCCVCGLPYFLLILML